ncbi:methyl-accepting chemotaxis protein [Stutzerimonas stutzeri]|uniref:Methyl-accepting chemotaxis protein n=1 Tax=Stutzerimonas stutzeri TaxID=316 RepID=A0A2S4AIW2_STUST|nr:methyl-accepting chemotaxis protein [Stutzerimonas stutzeri]MCQ4265460.1 methyl-accepting chemotaxis protein [Stutzerimonas stutzeri]POH81329.1 methyl-accepting chemotaxis protein [Stutzerimonas stutzeri]
MSTLKVSHKLILGFAAVLALTLAVALIGIYGMDALVSRSEKAQSAARLLDEANRIRYAQVSFETRGDPRHVEAVEQSVARITELVQQQRAEFSDPQDLQRLETIASDAQHYRERFLELAALWERKVKTRSSWVDAGNTSDALIAELESRWAGTPDNPVMHEGPRTAAIGLQAGEVSKHNRMVRFMVRGYLMTETEQSLQQLQQQFETLQAAVDRLDTQLAGVPGADLQPLRESVATYIRQFGQLPPIVAAQVQARAEMQAIFDSIYRNTNEIVQAQTDKRSVEADEKKALLLGITLLAVMLGLVISWLIVRQLTQPLAQAVMIAERIGAGDMTDQPRQRRSDEFGQLLDALDLTRGNLRDLLGQMSGITSRLAAAAQELSAVSEQASAGIQSQRLETDQVATAMHEMAATVQEVARNADEASGAAQQADRQAAQGNTVVQRALTQIDRLSSQVGLSAEAMDQLNREAAGISTVLTVINGIAEQTNLLALNAAIEAARAGEAGRGFAVVADEVRGLAQRTQQSTAQIEELIGNLQKGALHASSLMDSSRGLADETVSLARDVGDELQAITRMISTIQAMNLQIATASEEQSSVAEDINRSVLNVRDVADQSAFAAEQTAASTVQLARLGNELQTLAGRFRI